MYRSVNLERNHAFTRSTTVVENKQISQVEDMKSLLQTQTEATPGPLTPQGEMMAEGNICGVLVHAHPQQLTSVLSVLADLPGTEIHQSAPDGRVVITVEDAPGKWAGNTLTDISNIKGVLSAALVFHHRDTEDDDENESDVDEEVTQ
jgi:periplasmic nitrate reductase NapD